MGSYLQDLTAERDKSPRVHGSLVDHSGLHQLLNAHGDGLRPRFGHSLGERLSVDGHGVMLPEDASAGEQSMKVPEDLDPLLPSSIQSRRDRSIPRRLGIRSATFCCGIPHGEAQY